MTPDLINKIKAYLALIVMPFMTLFAKLLPEGSGYRGLFIIYIIYSAIVATWILNESRVLKYRLTTRSKLYSFLMMPLALVMYLVRSRSRRSTGSWIVLIVLALITVVELTFMISDLFWK